MSIQYIGCNSLIIDTDELERLLNNSTIKNFKYDIYVLDDVATITIDGKDTQTRNKHWSLGYTSFRFNINIKGKIESIYIYSFDTDDLFSEDRDRDYYEMQDTLNKNIKDHPEEYLEDTFNLVDLANIIEIDDKAKIIKEALNNIFKNRYSAQKFGTNRWKIANYGIISFNEDHDTWLASFTFGDSYIQADNTDLAYAIIETLNECKKYFNAMPALYDYFGEDMLKGE